MIRLTAPSPWQPAFFVALPHGIAAGVHLPGTSDPVPEDVLARLHPEERAHARSLGGFRQVEFTGGRIAIAELLPELGARPSPVLTNAHGAPSLPCGVIGSISHKREIAVAILARGTPGLGIDIEDTERDRPGVASRVLCPDELAAVNELAPERRWRDTAIRFSIKEAIYKALHPFVERYVAFDEVAVWPSPDGIARVEARLAKGEGPFRIDARHYWIDARVLSTARVRPG